MNPAATTTPTEADDMKLRTVVLENFGYPDLESWLFSLEFHRLLNSACNFNFTFSANVSDEKRAHNDVKDEQSKTGRLEIVLPTAQQAHQVYTMLQSSHSFGDRIQTLVDPHFFSTPESRKHRTFFTNLSEYDVFVLNLPRSADHMMVWKACYREKIGKTQLLPMPSGDGSLQAHVSITDQRVSERILARDRDDIITEGHFLHCVKIMSVEEYREFREHTESHTWHGPVDVSCMNGKREDEKELADDSHLPRITVSDLKHPGGWATSREIQQYLMKCSTFVATFSRPLGAPKQQRMNGQVNLVFPTVQAARDAYAKLQHLLIDGDHPSIHMDPKFIVKPDPLENGNFFEVANNPCHVYLLQLPESIDGNMIATFFGGERPVHFKTLPMPAEKNQRQAEVLLSNCKVAEKVLKGRRHYTLAHETENFFVVLLSLEEYKDYMRSQTSGKSHPNEITNWCHLPMEMRMKCIRLLDFESKMLLRRTSRTEKKLVEREKHKISSVIMSYENLDCRIFLDMCRKNGFRPKQMYGGGRHSMDISLLSSIAKFGSVDIFAIKKCKTYLVSFFDEIFQAAKMEAVELRFSQVADEVIEKILENHKPRREYSFEFSSISNTLMFKLCANAVLKPVFLGATRIKCEARSRVPINAIVDWWIEKDVATNRKLAVELCKCYREADGEVDDASYRQKVFDRFATDYGQRVIDRNDEMIRIRTDNDKKHIMLRLCHDNCRERCDKMIWKVIPCSLDMDHPGTDWW